MHPGSAFSQPGFTTALALICFGMRRWSHVMIIIILSSSAPSPKFDTSWLQVCKSISCMHSLHGEIIHSFSEEGLEYNFSPVWRATTRYLLVTGSLVYKHGFNSCSLLRHTNGFYVKELRGVCVTPSFLSNLCANGGGQGLMGPTRGKPGRDGSRGMGEAKLKPASCCLWVLAGVQGNVQCAEVWWGPPSLPLPHVG